MLEAPRILFVASYGAPALLPGAHSSPTPLTAANLPYVVCTTCHNQHVMNIFAASATNPIAGSATGTYATYFFINGPYNVNDVTSHSTSANSTTQFCRQCHFGEVERSQRRHPADLVLSHAFAGAEQGIGRSKKYCFRYFAWLSNMSAEIVSFSHSTEKPDLSLFCLRPHSLRLLDCIFRHVPSMCMLFASPK